MFFSRVRGKFIGSHAGFTLVVLYQITVFFLAFIVN